MSPQQLCTCDSLLSWQGWVYRALQFTESTSVRALQGRYAKYVVGVRTKATGQTSLRLRHVTAVLPTRTAAATAMASIAKKKASTSGVRARPRCPECEAGNANIVKEVKMSLDVHCMPIPLQNHSICQGEPYCAQAKGDQQKFCMMIVFCWPWSPDHNF